MATIRDIAKAAGVSVGTASRALTGNGYVAENTKLLVTNTAKELGYRVKERTRPVVNSKSIGVILPDITFPFYGTFLKYADVALDNMGYKTFVCNSLGIQNRVKNALDMLERHELDGLIINADVTDADIFRMEKLPVVCFERLVGNRIPMVSSDHRQGGAFAANAFITAGCKNVLILTAKHGNSLFGDIRIAVCRKDLEAHGIAVTVVEIPETMMSFRYGRELAAEYMTLYSQIDGIFSDDIVSCCCVSEAVKRGVSVPGQLKIVGYDNNEISKIFSMQLTTVEQDVPALAQTCVDILQKRIHGEKVEKTTLLPVVFITGETV